MRKLIITLWLLAAALGVRAQELISQRAANTCAEDAPHRVEVAYSKTLHILFPAAVKYVDLGSTDLIAGKAEGADNVVRIKAAVRDFPGETNFSVITADGVFYTFDAVYSDNPSRLSLVMEDWLSHDPYNPQAGRQRYIRMPELGDQTPLAVARSMYAIYAGNHRHIKTLGSKRYAIQVLLKGIYVQEELFYFHLSVRNASKVSFDVDHIRFRITDRKVARRTAQQETFVEPIREYRPLQAVRAGEIVRNVYVLRKFTIPDDKVLVIDLFERNGGRHQSFTVQNSDLINARGVQTTEP